MKTTLAPFSDVSFASGSLIALVIYAVAMSALLGQHTLHILSSCKTFGLILCGGHLLGTLWGTYLMICLAGVVLGGLFAAMPGSQDALRVSAGFYILWLAWQLWCSDGLHAAQAMRPLRFGEAVLRQLSNSEIWLLAVTVIAGFVHAGDQYIERMLTVALLFCLAMLPASVLWAMRGSVLQSSILFRPPLLMWLVIVTAAMALLFWT